MPLGALLLALAAAFLHALWNLLLAREEEPEPAGAVALCVAVLAFAPVALATGGVGSAAVPYVVASSALELAYFALLAAAYRRAELSVVYPLSRGLAPVLVLAVGAVALGSNLSAAGVGGVLLVGIGVVLVRGLGRLEEGGDLAFSVAIACCIAGYTLVDKEGLRHAAPIAYLELVLVVPAAIYLPAIGRLRGRAALRTALVPVTAAAGLAMFGAYALTLAALELAPAAAVAAVRESSVVIATGLAALFLSEAVAPRRLAGACLVAAGVALVGAS